MRLSGVIWRRRYDIRRQNDQQKQVIVLDSRRTVSALKTALNVFKCTFRGERLAVCSRLCLPMSKTWAGRLTNLKTSFLRLQNQRLSHRNTYSLQVRSSTEILLRDLVRKSFRLRPQRQSGFLHSGSIHCGSSKLLRPVHQATNLEAPIGLHQNMECRENQSYLSQSYGRPSR